MFDADYQSRLAGQLPAEIGGNQNFHAFSRRFVSQVLMKGRK